jgi:hypothetical protein
MTRVTQVRIYVAPKRRNFVKGVAHTIKLTPLKLNTRGKTKVLHGKIIFRNRHSGRRINGRDVISRITAHLNTYSWKSEARIGSIGRKIPTSYHKSWLRDMTPTKLKGRIRRHHASIPKTRVHIRQ